MGATAAIAPARAPAGTGEEEARQRLREHLASGGVTQRQVAAAIDRSASAVSLWLRGEYTGDSAEMGERIARYLERQSAVSQIRRPGWVETSIAQGVLSAVHYADVSSEIVLVVGSPGQGKTTALKQYCDSHKHAVWVSCWPGTSGAKALLEDLVGALGLRHRDMGRTMRATMAGVVEALRGTGRLVVVDEAQHLQAKALECLRHIHDETGVGMVLAGNLECHPLLRREGAGMFAQLFSRIATIHTVPAVATEADVAALARSAVPGLDAAAVEALVAVVRAPGGDLRQLVRVLDSAQSMSQRMGRPVSAAMVQAAQGALRKRVEVRA